MGAKLGHLIGLAKGYWAYTGKFSITNISRWTIGGSTRSNERFYASEQDWVSNTVLLIQIFFLSHQEPNPSDKHECFLAFDETIGKKAGKHTHGIGIHYSSKDQRPIKSIAVMGLSLVDPKTKLSIPFTQQQLEFPTVEKPDKKKKAKKKARKKAKKKVTPPTTSKESSKAKKVTPPTTSKESSKAKKDTATKKKVGRPKGSKNKPKQDVQNTELAHTFQVLQQTLATFKQEYDKSLSPLVECKYGIGDGAYGNNTAAKLCKEVDLYLISKLQYNAALHFPFEGEYEGTGAPRKYGDKIDYDTFEVDYADFLVERQVQTDGAIWKIYHIGTMLHKKFDTPVNIVIIFKYDTKGVYKGRKSNAVMFSTDLEASHTTILTYYQSRFQIEFDFRDARQFFGLQHFKNIKKIQVTNVIGFAFFMVALSRILLYQLRLQNPTKTIGIEDLNAFFRAEKYFNELLNMDGFEPSEFLNKDSFQNIPLVGMINAA